MRELKGFKKFGLKPSETTKIFFELGYKELGYFLENGEYTVEQGKFRVYIGSDSLTENYIEVELI